MEAVIRKDGTFFPIFFILLAGLIFLGWKNAFIQDDAFISFRYAANLADGHGLVWNPGERREGYTNFLWTVIMALPHAFGFGPVIFLKILGIATLGCSLAITFITTEKVLHSRAAGLAAMLLTGGNYTFSAYATGGLETQLQALLIIAGFFTGILIHENPTRLRFRVLFSLVCGFGLLTRLDSTLPLMVMGTSILIGDLRNKDMTASKITARWLPLVLPVLLLVLPWLVWKAIYYGSLLPNTFFVKAATPTGEIFTQGARYILLFLNSYWLTPFLLLAVFFSKTILTNRFLIQAGAAALLWGLYVIYVGGDFMEFRFLVPVLPLFFILISAAIWQIQPILPRALLIGIILIGSWRHWKTFENRDGVESIRALHAHVAAPEENWIGAGKRLGELFGHLPGVRIATTAAGAIPYYSGLYSVDMLGLNDAWVARHGITLGSRPGHQRISPLSYLIERKVNLVIGQPMVLPRGIRPADHPAFRNLEILELMDLEPNQLPGELLMVEIPLDSLYTLSVVYLQQDEGIDRVIQTQGLATYPITVKPD